MTDAGHAVAHAATLPPLFMFPSVIVGTMLLAYFIGSIPFGLILAKLYKVGDLRTNGSGNIGATNMLRVGGRNLAIATLALDMAKGYIAVQLCGALLARIITSKFTTDNGISLDISRYYYFFGLYAVIGHVWPVWLKGKGGKGVATALGSFLAFAPIVGLLSLAFWMAIFAITQYSSLSALVSICLAPLLCVFFGIKSAGPAAALIALIVVYRHKDNIKRLMKGTEPKSQLTKKE